MKFEDIEIEEVDFGAMLEESFKREESGMIWLRVRSLKLMRVKTKH